jgi:antitoxin (DNA-binding transcriptional repressor) of toxin-antitoxin stability system
MINLITATQAKNQLSEIFNRVIYQGEEFIVQKQGKPVVLITKALKANITQPKKFTNNDFLAKLAQIKAEGLPKDLGENLDKYAWD